MTQPSINKESVILIVGGTGSVGSILTQQFLELGVKEVRVLARDETRHQQLADSLNNPKNLMSIIGDIRDPSSMEEAFNGVSVVINAAAMKHVRYCDAYPAEAIKTNVEGTQNLLKLCNQHGVRQFVLISSDKAANPSTTYGATKFLAEQLVIASSADNSNRRYTAVRLGNVLGSRNSVLWRLAQLIETGKPIAVTKNEMTRYVMTIEQAANLVIAALTHGRGGEIFIKDMPVVAIQNLVAVFLERYTERHKSDVSQLKTIDYPLQHGEKLHESLISITETSRVKLHKDLLIISPRNTMTADNEVFVSQFGYSSDQKQMLSSSEINALLDASGL